MIQQISVFAENQPGKLERLTGILAPAGVNIRALTIGDLGEFGVIKLLVDQPEKGYAALKEAGVAARLVDVVAVPLDDAVGGLDRAARILAENRVNIKHAYGFVIEKGREAVFIFEVESAPQVADMLSKAGYRVLNADDLARL